MYIRTVGELSILGTKKKYTVLREHIGDGKYHCSCNGVSWVEKGNGEKRKMPIGV